jgi:hypothetical protein
MGKSTAAYRFIVEIPDEKRPLEIAGLRWGHGLR